MLEKQKWMNYSLELSLEWKQARDEGKDVDDLKEICEFISKKAETEDCKKLAIEISNKLINAPVKEDFAFTEPSTLDEIKSAKPKRRHKFKFEVDDTTLKSKLSGAWIGRISGCLLGKPVECMKTDLLYPLLKQTDNYPMKKYIMKKDFHSSVDDLLKDWHNHFWADTLSGVAPVDDDTNYTVFTMKLIEEYGRDFRPNDVLEAWLSWMPMFATCTAERVAYRNAAMGLYAPETATYQNPYREWIGAQIRGDFYGYLNPANPEMAAEMAWRDASISHVKNGIYGEMFVASLISAACVCDDMMVIIEAGLDEIPEKCRLRHDVDLVLKWYINGVSAIEAINKIHELYDENDGHDWCHTNSNAMIVVMSLLYGEKDFGKSICLAVQAAFDTDCNGATVGSIIGIMLGENNIPSYWYECYDLKLSTSIDGYNRVSITELAEKTLQLIKV